MPEASSDWSSGTFGKYMPSDAFKLISDYSLNLYPCGLKAGDRLSIKREIQIEDHDGKKTGVTFPIGEVWTVLSGVPTEPNVIWLRQADGNRHTWDAEDIFDTFVKEEE